MENDKLMTLLRETALLSSKNHKELKRLRAIVKRLSLALIDANTLDYPWKDGSRASKALNEAEDYLRNIDPGIKCLRLLR